MPWWCWALTIGYFALAIPFFVWYGRIMVEHERRMAKMRRELLRQAFHPYWPKDPA